MLRSLVKILLFIFLLPSLIIIAKPVKGDDVPLDLKTIISVTIPLRNDGKIDIPVHIKHVKLDIGLSYNAPMSQNWLSQENNLVVFGFEPNPSSVNSILQGAVKRDSSHGAPLEKKFIGKNFFLIPCALGLSQNKTVPFYVTKNDCGCSSLFVPKDFEVESVIQVPIFSLKDFFDIFPFDTHPIIDYIKIDAQGADLDIVKSAGDYLHQNVVFVTLEAEDAQYEETINSTQAIEQYMNSIGFVRHIFSCTADPTYINSRYLDYARDNSLYIYQRG